MVRVRVVAPLDALVMAGRLLPAGPGPGTRLEAPNAAPTPKATDGAVMSFAPARGDALACRARCPGEQLHAGMTLVEPYHRASPSDAQSSPIR
jgi:hypothetical protein